MLGLDSMSEASSWIERALINILGRDWVSILEAVDRTGSLSKASRELGLSYRSVWDCLNRMSKVFGAPIVEARRGGRGGGGARLSEFGGRLLRNFKRGFKGVEGLEALGFKVSARNRVRGVVKEVVLEGSSALVKIEVQELTTLTSLLSKEAVEELELKKGDVVEALFKATEVLVVKVS